jgi:hypothetical protein
MPSINGFRGKIRVPTICSFADMPHVAATKYYEHAVAIKLGLTFTGGAKF